MAPVTDAVWMRKALQLAEHGWGQVHPNPLVGAVVVRDGRLVGQGWHARHGDAHAEPVALTQAGDAARGATLYVTLEPCAHHGKQPPCVDAIIAAGVVRVVMGIGDPDPRAAGGAGRLRDAGIAVDVGVEEGACRRINFRFLHRFGPSRRPFVAIKLAVTMDGMIADHHGCSRWISGELARDWVHRERAGYDALAIGAETAIADDARLTVRGPVQPRVAPSRVIFDRTGRLPADHGILDDGSGVPVVIVREPGRPGVSPADRGVIIVESADLGTALVHLRDAGIDAMLVEGGGRLAGALLDAGLVDRIYQIQSPVWLGGGRTAWSGLGERGLDAAIRWRTVGRRLLGEDTLLVLEP